MTDRELLEKVFSKISGMETKMTGMDTKISGMETKMTSMDTKISGMETKMTSMDTKISGIMIQQKEAHTILEALEHKSEINKSEHDSMFNKITHIEGNSKNIEVHLKNIDENIDALKEILGRHEVDIRVLQRRPV